MGFFFRPLRLLSANLALASQQSSKPHATKELESAPWRVILPRLSTIPLLKHNRRRPLDNLRYPEAIVSVDDDHLTSSNYPFIEDEIDWILHLTI